MAASNVMTFGKDSLDALFGELEAAYGDSGDYEQLLRDTHLGVALSDAGHDPRGAVDARAVALLEKHRPG